MKLTTLFLLVAFASACGRSAESAPNGRNATRIVALVVVDQFPPDLLERYRGLWTSGFRRMLEQGYGFSQASHPHAITETGPGHATLATGVPPSRNGIVGNEWWELDGNGKWREVVGVEQLDSHVLGLPDADGRGPANLARQGITAWVRSASPSARVVSISKKDRGAILLAGDAPDAHVYWLDAPTGRFVTSSSYRSSYPDWVERFNRETMPVVMADTVWESSVPAAAAALSTPDTVPGEWDGKHTAFPHHAWAEVSDSTTSRRNTWVAESPVLDSAVLELALSALRELGLGKESQPDFLALSFSSTDYVGHNFGPLSREQLDNLLRLDRLLGRLFDALDAAAGPDGWLVALSSDHGVLDLPEPGFGWRKGRLSDDEHATLMTVLGQAGSGGRLHDDGSAGPSQNGGVGRALRAVAALPYVAAAYPMASLEAGERPDSFAVLYAHNLFPGRFPDDFSQSGVFVRLQPGILVNNDRATNHGSPYWYDRHVPVFFLGGGILPGMASEPVSTLDVAPTLARLAGIPAPADLDGHALEIPRRSP